MIPSPLLRIKAILTDVDGCLTDGSIYLGIDAGEELAAFDVHDGVAHRLAQVADLPVVWLTGRVSKSVAGRAKRLGVAKLFQGRVDKVKTAEAWCKSRGLKMNEVVYIGDDLIDVPLMKKAGWAVAPANARPEAKQAADYVTKTGGGHGVFREVVETVLRRQGKWSRVRAIYERGAAKGMF
jgi:3-deoxy-D-manno-octulosonate 8-phosphate phosphatase (KDO 8-P phosphatase)